jgi:HSP20 family protein
MSLIKKDKQRLFPWNSPMINPWSNTMLKNFFSADDFFNDDFFEEDSLMPAMNVKETKDQLKVELAAPGFSKKDFEVTLDEDVLHISAEKTKKEEEQDKETGYSRKEFSYNSFKRSLKLPVAINQDQKVKATYDNGILKISLKKVVETKEAHTMKIEVA